MIGIALNMDDLRGHVLGFVTNRINEHAAAHRAIWTGGARLGGAGNLEFAKLGVGGRQIKPEQQKSGASQCGDLQKISAAGIHGLISFHVLLIKHPD